MKHLLLSIGLLFSTTFALFGSETENLELRKKITKTFECPASKSVEICNTYGKITVVVYSGSQVKYDIDVVAKADSKAKAQKELDRVSVLFNDNTAKVSAKTSIEDKSSWFNWNWSWNGNSEIQINYTLYVPDNRSLILSQTYGNVYLPNYGGQTNLDVAYGNIEGADLTNTTTVDLSYGEGKLGCIKNGKFDIAYSDFTINSTSAITTELQYGKFNIIETCESLNIETDYSDINIGNVNKISGSGGYNHYQIASAGDVKMDNEYGDVTIAQLKGNVNVNSDYHSIKIENVSTTVREINVYGDYSSLKVLSADGYTYNVTGSYNTVKAPNSNTTGDDDDKVVKGSKKGSKSNALIKVSGDYMHVSLR